MNKCYHKSVTKCYEVQGPSLYYVAQLVFSGQFLDPRCFEKIQVL